MKAKHMELLAKDMRMTATELDAQPDEREWTREELEALEALRCEARRLADVVQATFDEIQGAA